MRRCATTRIFRELGERGIDLKLVNLGRRLPCAIPEERADSCNLWRGDHPRTAAPFRQSHPTDHHRAGPWSRRRRRRYQGRGRAGLAQERVQDPQRWVYLDLGKFGGLAETMNESIRYPIRTKRDADETVPCVVAGPTCDSADILYEKIPYNLPVSLATGDEVLIEAAGAYTATYSSVGFNGFPPLRSYIL